MPLIPVDFEYYIGLRHIDLRNAYRHIRLGRAAQGRA
jgi:hypothetical protein